MSNHRYDFNDTIPVNHPPVEGQARRPLMPRLERATRSTGTRLIAAVLMVSVCAVLALLVAGPAQ